MDEELDITGYWWMADTDDEKSSGRLEFSSELGGSLRVSFPNAESPPGLFSLHSSEAITLFGIGQNNKLYTLQRCHLRSTSKTFLGISKASFLVERIVVGIHAPPNRDILAKQIWFNVCNLENWHDGCGSEVIESNEVSSKHQSIVRFTNRLESEYEISHGTVLIHSGYSTEYSSDKNKSAWEQVSYVSIGYNESISAVDAVNRWVFPLSQLFTLLIGSHVLPYNFRFVQPDSNDEIRILLQGYENSNVEDVLKHHMLFTFDDVSDRFQSILSNWCDLVESAPYMLSLFFESVYPIGTLDGNRFLNCVQVVESYFESFRDVNMSDEQEFELRVARIVNNADKIDRKLLRRMLKHANRKSLPVRLTEILSECKWMHGLGKRKLSKISQDIARHRNLYSHGDEQIVSVFNSREAFFEYGVLRWSIIALLLMDIGIPKAEIERALERNSWFRGFRDQFLQD